MRKIDCPDTQDFLRNMEIKNGFKLKTIYPDRLVLTKKVSFGARKTRYKTYYKETCIFCEKPYFVIGESPAEGHTKCARIMYNGLNHYKGNK